MAAERSGQQLREDIDSGRTGDKVDFPDPAAAPLGTDAEAGGASTAFPDERRAVQRGSSGLGGFVVYLAFMLAIAAAATLLIWLAMRSR